jgi:NadR type nicotinamide-nucleotide adenylyltransferase
MSNEKVSAEPKRVALVGAESTGKTTLAKRLAEHYGTAWVAEHGREYSETVGHHIGKGYVWREEEFAEIARVQHDWENDAARHANRVLICDTDVLATEIWQERYLGSRTRFPYRRPDLYLVADPAGFPFVADEIRDSEHLRDWMTQRFIAALNEEHLPFVMLSGPADERFDQAVTAIDRLLSCHPERSAGGAQSKGRRHPGNAT